MLTFIIPLKSQKISKDWQTVTHNFRNTLNSIANQTVPDWQIIVACHEMPDVDFSYPDKIHVVKVQFPPPDMILEQRRFKQTLFRHVKRLDKFKKVRVATGQLLHHKTDYVMIVDADDLVSNRLCEFVADHDDCNGWFFPKGYRWNANANHIYKIDDGFWTFCGSSAIVKVSYKNLTSKIPINIDPVNLSLVESGYPFLDVGHRKIVEYMESIGKPLMSLPFPGAVYVKGHGENNSQQYGESRILVRHKLKQGIADLKARRPLSSDIKREFGLAYKLAGNGGVFNSTDDLEITLINVKK